MAKRMASGLTDQHELFARHYVKTHNASLSARAVGYSAEVAGSEGNKLLHMPAVAQYIRLLKGAVNESLHVEAVDVMRKVIQTAFVDITAFVEQETEWVPDIGPDGKQKEDQGFPMYKPVLVTRMKPLDQIDGGLIKKIKATKHSVEIELEPRDKAMEMLSKHFGLFVDQDKRALEREYLDIEKRKLALLEKSAAGGDIEVTIDKNNARILTLTNLLKSPNRNRTIEDIDKSN